MVSEALLLIDIQNDYFAGGAFPLPGMEAAAARAAELLSWARGTGRRVVHIRHEENDPEGGFLLAGSDGCRIHEIVKPRDDEPVITKRKPNCFVGTDLLSHLAGISRVIIAGAMSNMCIDAGVRAASDYGFEVTIVEDACAACALKFAGQEIPARVVHGTFMAALASDYGKVESSRNVIT